MILHMSRTVLRTTEITVDLPPQQAMELFTAEGERRWVDGWDSQYPDADRREGPGAVFTTEHAGHQTTWIMVDHGPESVRYARVTHGMTAGTVAVDVVESDEHSTRVRVTYDLTALSSAGESWLDAFDADYDSAIGGWATEIAAGLQRP
jgi:polyketide cyclase/dehydrase/lipid transport protein